MRSVVLPGRGIESLPRSLGAARARAVGLPPGVRRMVTVLVCVAHVVAIVGLLQVGAVREAVREAVPIFAGLIHAFPPPIEPEASPIPRTVRRIAPPPIIAAPPSRTQATPEFVVSSTPAEDVVAPEASAAPAVAVAGSVAPPRTLSATEVGYLEPPRVTYPAISRRLGEEGRVLLRVLVDPQGHPAQVVLSQSSGHARLDEAATSAARRARFRPYSENGVAQTVWVLLPIVFTLEARP
jgi:periplasmic protein TonB